MTPAITDQLIQIGTSSYKWLTQTLFNAQNQFTVRPALSCQIVDQTLLVNQQMYNTTSTNGFSGDAVMAPDGSILAIGSDGSNNLVFAKITDGTQISQWNEILNGTGLVLVAAGSWQSHNTGISSVGFHFNASIAVSEYIGGNYTIDVYYWWVAFGNYLKILRLRSTNSGASFTSYTDLNTGSFPTISSSSYGLVQVVAGTPVYIPGSSPTTSASVFYLIGPQISGTYTNDLFYQYTTDGTSYGSSTPIFWNHSFPNYQANDWVFHSFDIEYINNVYYIVFSGYHSVMASTNPSSGFSAGSLQSNFFGNFGLYLMELRQITSTGNTNPPTPIFTEPKEVIEFNSSSITNLNQALYPSLNYDGTY